jgi:N-methylhydantoinase A
MTLAAARALPVAALLSGPAGGVVASAALGAVLGDTRLISFDMGGTSTDVCRIDGGDPEVGYERVIDGLPVRVPTVAIHTVGAGGGSIGWADTGGALRVGPRSAGATPGPAAYGRGGGEPAVTDANLVLGRIPGDARLAGRVALDVGLSRAALARLGEAVGLDVVGVATGMIEVVEAHMERAVRAVSVEEGADPRPARLVAFGGAGGLHATALARRLEMRGVVVPPHAGVFSALGLLLAPPRHDTARSVLLDDADATGLDRAVRAVMDDARDGLAALGGSAEVVEAFVDVRYRGQAHETTVPYRPAEGWTALEDRFHDRHHDRNGFARRGDPIEVVTVRAVASADPALRWGDLPEHRPQGTRDLGERSVVFDGVARSVRFFDRAALGPGDEVVGPAVVVEGEATTLLHPGDRATVHPTGALEVEW